MKKLFIFLLIMVVIVVSGLSYIGVMPFFSGFIAKQVDLGMKADPSLVTAFETKYGKPNGTGKKYIKYIAGDLPFYIKGTGGMTNNVLAINPTTLQIGRVTVPESITKLAAVGLGDMIERRIAQIGGAYIKDASFKTGAFHLDGTVPETIKY